MIKLKKKNIKKFEVITNSHFAGYTKKQYARFVSQTETEVDTIFIDLETGKAFGNIAYIPEYHKNLNARDCSFHIPEWWIETLMGD